MARPLTAKMIEHAKPDPKRRTEIPDGAVTGLRLIVQPSGQRSFAVRYRFGGRPAKLTLGSYPRLKLSDAREAAQQVLRLVSEGKDPTADRVTLASLKRLPAPVADHRFEQVLDRFIKAQEVKGRRSTEEIRRVLDKDATPHWRGRPIASITAADVVERIESITIRGAPVAASRFRAWLSKLFSYAVKSQLRIDNPAKATENPIDSKSRQRKRSLTDRELTLVWHAAEKLGYPYGTGIRILTLTGQRLREVLNLPRSELDLEQGSWRIAPERAKNNQEHWVHLSPAARNILAAVPVIDGGYVFTTRGDTPISGYSKSKKALDALVTKANGGKPIPHWTPHDLRRTFSTGCAALGIALPVVEKILNHTGGSLGGIAGVYNVHQYKAERVAALDAWTAHVLALAEGKPAKVVKFSRPVA